MTDETTEVKDIEVVEVEPTKDEEVVEEETTKEPDGETETPTEPSTETKPDGATEGEGTEKKTGEEVVKHDKPETEPEPKPEEGLGIVEPSDDSEIKRLPTETPREFALRLEVTKLRRGNREKRAKDLLGEDKAPKGITQAQFNELDKDDKAILEKYSPEDVKSFESILNVMAKKQGWVKKTELDSTRREDVSNDIFDGFIKDHPEYLPENDKDDVLWGRFKDEYNSGVYNISPENPKQLKRVLNRIHNDIFGVKSEEELKKISAKKEKIKVASHSGSSASGGKSSTEETKLTSEQKSHLKGFSDKDLNDLGL